MSSVTKVRCPGCRNLLRIPTDWLARPIRCKHCAKSFRPGAEERAGVDNPFAFSEPDGDANLHTIPVNAGLHARGHRSSIMQWVVLAAAALTALAIGTGFYFRGPAGGPPDTTTAANTAAEPLTKEPVPAKEPSKSVEAPKPVPAFPRRFLAVCIHNYLYANPVSARGERTVMPEMLRSFAREKLQVPPDQICVLSDAALRDPRPPIKPIVEGTIERFLATCRPQDRIMLVFVGHALDADDQAYLVPLEGELAVKGSLIPVNWLFDRLAACPARQKVLVMDVCRTDVARGNDRPGGGPMGLKLDAALAHPPVGVQVLTACVAGQSSHEFDAATAGRFTVRGGAFLNLFAQAPQVGWSTPKPADPLPIGLLTDRVKEPLAQLVAERDKAEQTARLAGAEAGETAGYDPAAPPPPRIDVPRPADVIQGGLANPQLVRTIFGEIALPPIKSAGDAENAMQASGDAASLAIVPFRANALNGYEADYADLRQILDRAKEYPLRVAVIHAVAALDGLARSGKARLMDEFHGPATDDVKKSITDSQKEGPARLELELSKALDELRAVEDRRREEKSKRWLAHFDYVLAQVLARKAYVAEYNLMLGKAKRDELPPLDPKRHNGYRIVSQEKLQSPKEIKDLASESRKLFAKVIAENPGTPWELLAKRERITALGLAWQPARLDR
jgi:hypothetical protein